MVKRLLIVSRDGSERDAIRHTLIREGYTVDTVDSVSKAQEILGSGEHWDLALIDWNLADSDCVELLEWIHREASDSRPEVILQSSKVSPEDLRKGLENGAYYYLTRPYQMAQLQAVVRTALSDSDLKRSLAQKIQHAEDTCRLLHEGTFRFRTLVEAEALAVGLASMCHADERGLGLMELLVNAVEHGNLGIQYQEKGRLLADGTYEKEIERRLGLPENRDKHVKVSVRKHAGQMQIVIEDSGVGFDFDCYQDFDQDCIFDSHGRGILLARAMLDLQYIEPGNKVQVTIPLPK